MPFYDYKCEECGKSFTLLLSMNDRNKAECPECGSKNVKQQFKSFNIGKGSSSSCTRFG